MAHRDTRDRDPVTDRVTEDLGPVTYRHRRPLTGDDMYKIVVRTLVIIDLILGMILMGGTLYFGYTAVAAVVQMVDKIDTPTPGEQPARPGDPGAPTAPCGQPGQDPCPN